MSDKTNYNKISKNEKKSWTAPTVQTIPANELENNTIVPDTITKDDPKPIVDEIKKVSEEPVKGKVVNCTKLNIRKGPSMTSEIVTVIEKGSEVTINTDFVHDKFYKVRYGANKGFCVKDYIVTNK